MTGSRTISLVSALLLGAATFCWTTAGQTSSPQLSVRELPAEILNNCNVTDCAEYRMRWVGQISRNELFIVSRFGCAPSSCTYWLVEKGAAPVRVLLELDGPFTLQRNTGNYPVIEIRTEDDEDGIVYRRYEWNGQQYARSSVRHVYEVNGVECGTREQCRAAAERALKAHQVDRALRIWQQVDGVSWI